MNVRKNKGRRFIIYESGNNVMFNLNFDLSGF